MSALLRVTLGLWLTLLWPTLAAHEVRPAYLQIREVQTQHYDLLWKTPAQGDQRRQVTAAVARQPAGAEQALAGRTHRRAALQRGVALLLADHCPAAVPALGRVGRAVRGCGRRDGESPDGGSDQGAEVAKRDGHRDVPSVVFCP